MNIILSALKFIGALAILVVLFFELLFILAVFSLPDSAAPQRAAPAAHERHARHLQET